MNKVPTYYYLLLHIAGLVKIYRLLQYNGQNNMPIRKICEYIFEDLARWPRGNFYSGGIF